MITINGDGCRFVIFDTLTQEFLASYLPKRTWTEDLDEVKSSALFDSLDQAMRVRRILIDTYEKIGEDDELDLVVKTVITVSTLKVI